MHRLKRKDHEGEELMDGQSRKPKKKEKKEDGLIQGKERPDGEVGK